MKFKTIDQQKQAANENLTMIKAPFRLSFMVQNRPIRITIDIGTPEQIEQGTATNSLLSYATLNETSKFLMGFNACLNCLNQFNHPVNKG